MSCFKPLSAYRGEVLPSGKRGVVFKSGDAPPGLSFGMKLPCGQCYGCRLDYSYDWAIRACCEMQMHSRNCLILLTYDKLPLDGSLQLEDWQNFMKALRREVGPVRHMHSGEYGEKNGRPHDHALLFGFDVPDRKYLKMSNAGFPLYRSDMLLDIWKKGHVSVGNASFESAGYVARYLMDKMTLTKAIKGDGGEVIARGYTEKAIEKYGEEVDVNTGEITLLRRPEYLTVSRRPGLGETWLRKYWRDVYPHDYVLLPSGMKMPPPRYFDVKVEEWNSVDMNAIKLHRIERCQKKEEVWNKVLKQMQMLDVNRDERLLVMEEVKRAQVGLYNSERGAML